MIKIKTPNATIKAHFNSEYDERVLQVLIMTLEYVGEACVKEARDGGTYKDRTGNLRSSIGYVIVHNGQIVRRGSTQKYKDGSEGVQTTQDFLTSVAKEYTGITLIVAAGMKYAACVEAKGYTVLTSAELLADKLVPQLLGQIGFTK